MVENLKDEITTLVEEDNIIVTRTIVDKYTAQEYEHTLTRLRAEIEANQTQIKDKETILRVFEDRELECRTIRAKEIELAKRERDEAMAKELQN